MIKETMASTTNTTTKKRFSRVDVEDGGTPTYTAEVPTDVRDEYIHESMENLKEKLDFIKSMVSDSGSSSSGYGSSSGGSGGGNGKAPPVFVDANVLSAVFAIALAAIIGVTIYAFQGLYVAVHKKWSSK